VRVGAGAEYLQIFADRLRRREQRAIVGGVGRTQRLSVQADGVDRDEAEHRQQDAEQQPAAKREPFADLQEAAFSR